ncbi:MAG: glycosyltransferase family 9 protein [Spirochaetales bacterium]|nr:glycosyltransferase family 9 protein [Spirochaetales bacterium]
MKKILIIKPSALGDIVHALPFLAAIKRTYPNCEVHWVVARGLHTFLEGHSLIHKLWIFEKKRWGKLGNVLQTVLDLRCLWRDLHAERFDVSVDLSGLLRSGLLTVAAGAKRKCGFSDAGEGSSFFYNDTVVGGEQIHALDRYLKLATHLGCASYPVEYPLAPLGDPPALMAQLPERFAVFAPSAGKPANRWPAERFGQLAKRLKIPVVVVASEAEKVVAEEAVKASGNSMISVAGQTSLKELTTLIGRAQFFVTNDTGPMHIAAAQGVPVVALFGPANPVRTGPYGAQHIILQEELDCIPCYAWQPCSHWRCMKNLTVDRVFECITSRLMPDEA